MIYVEAPDIYDTPLNSIFLAGGITDCPDWQAEVVDLLSQTDRTLLNPRRKNFPIDDPSAAEEQIQWEYLSLRNADTILFWFPQEALCPIALYELGAWTMTQKPLFVGVHSNYERRTDVEIQTALARPEVKLVYTLSDLVDQVIAYE